MERILTQLPESFLLLFLMRWAKFPEVLTLARSMNLTLKDGLAASKLKVMLIIKSLFPVKQLVNIFCQLHCPCPVVSAVSAFGMSQVRIPNSSEKSMHTRDCYPCSHLSTSPALSLGLSQEAIKQRSIHSLLKI